MQEDEAEKKCPIRLGRSASRGENLAVKYGVKLAYGPLALTQSPRAELAAASINASRRRRRENCKALMKGAN